MGECIYDGKNGYRVGNNIKMTLYETEYSKGGEFGLIEVEEVKKMDIKKFMGTFGAMALAVAPTTKVQIRPEDIIGFHTFGMPKHLSGSVEAMTGNSDTVGTVGEWLYSNTVGRADEMILYVTTKTIEGIFSGLGSIVCGMASAVVTASVPVCMVLTATGVIMYMFGDKGGIKLAKRSTLICVIIHVINAAYPKQ